MSNLRQIDLKMRIDELLQILWGELRTRQQIRADYEVDLERLNAKYARRRGRVNGRIVRLRTQLANMIKLHRESLITGKLKSFTTDVGVFEFKNTTTRFKVIDAKGALDVARKLGVVRKIAKIKVSWTVDPKMLQEFLRQHGDYIEDFDEFIEPGGMTIERLYVRPQSFTKDSDEQLKTDAEQLDPLPQEKD